MKHVQIMRVPGWDFWCGEACYYGRRWVAHVGPFLIFLWQMTDDEMEAWDVERMKR
jgi:hypothetical protein